MKGRTLFTLIALCFTLTIASCTKEQTAPPLADLNDHNKIAADMTAAYTVTDGIDAYDIVGRYLTDSEFDSLYECAFSLVNIWPKDVWYAVTASPASKISKEEKLELLRSYFTRDEGLTVETIARKPTGNINVNGGQAYWDASGDILALTIASLNTAVDPKSTINYLNSGASANSITMGDVLRAVNGYNNTAFNELIEITDVVFEFPVSGDNWLIGATITYEGEEYLYSNFTIPGFPNLGPLVYDPVEGGAAIVGPLPGGITYVSGDAWDAPLTE